MTDTESINFDIHCSYELPADLDERKSIYGTIDPLECLQVDLDNDPAAFLASYAEVLGISLTP